MRLRSVVAVFTLAIASGCSAAPSADDSQVERDTPDELGTCTSTTATNAQHVAAGRAYKTTRTFGNLHFDTYFATGSNENLGSSGNLRTKLYLIAPGVYSRSSRNCTSSGAGEIGRAHV